MLKGLSNKNLFINLKKN